MSTSVEREVSQADSRRSLRRSDFSAKKRMRVGIFTDSYPPVVNGVTTSVLTLVDQLERLGHAVFVFAPRFPGHSGDPENVVRFPSILTPFDPGYPLAVPFCRQVISSVAHYNLDIIHSQSPFMLGLVAMMVARAEGKPLVATNHTLYTEYSHYVPVVPEELTKGVTRSMVRWYYERCDAVIAPSRMAAGRLSEGYGIHKTIVKVVPTGIPVPKPICDAEKAATRLKYGVSPNGKMLLFAGRIAKEKNLGMLLDAFEQDIHPAHPEARLILAGSGPDAEAIQERINSSAVLRENAQLTGFINRPQLDPLYASADLFVFPSVTETQGVVLGEALAAGTPCCAVDAAGSPETVTDGVDGILTPNNGSLFSASVNYLLGHDELRKSMAEAAVRLAKQRSPEHMAEQIVSVYRAAQKRLNLRRKFFFGVAAPAPAAMLRKHIFFSE